MLNLSVNVNDDLSINVIKDKDNYLLTITEGAFVITLPMFNTTIECIKYWLDNDYSKTLFESVLYKNYKIDICSIDATNSIKIIITYSVNQRSMEFVFTTSLIIFKAWINLLSAYEDKT